jgi:urease accessory protein
VALREAKLELTFAARNGQTFIAKQSATSPLKIWRPFEVGDGRVLVQLVNVSPGLMADDVYKININVEEGAKVILVNQSATKLHQMPDGMMAKQTVDIQVANNAELEYYPGLTIPFPETYYKQRVLITLAEQAKFAMLERYAVGRVERGEVHQFRCVSSQIRIIKEGKPIYADGLELAEGIGLLEGHSYGANGVWCWGALPRVDAVTSDKMLLVRGRASPEVGYLRALAQDGLELKTCLDTVIKKWRREQGMAEVMFSRFMS